VSTLIDNTAGFTLTEGLLDFVISGNSGMYDSIVSNAVDGVEYAYKAKFADGVTAGYESGKGVYSSATSSIARTTIFTSSNSGAKVDFAAGQKFIALVSNKETINSMAGKVESTSNKILTAAERNIISAFTFAASVVTVVGGTLVSLASVGIGTATPAATAILDVQSTTKGLRFPNMTTTQKNAISASAGTVVFDTTLSKLCVHTGSAWQTITSA
jgi:hypothetical protein